MTKTLEETIEKMQVAPCGEYVPPTKERLMEIVREIHNAAIDTAIGNLPEDKLINRHEDLEIAAKYEGFNDCLEETLQTLLKMKV